MAPGATVTATAPGASPTATATDTATSPATGHTEGMDGGMGHQHDPHGGEPVIDHRWVVHEELGVPGQAPLAEGTRVVLDAEHMAGMDGTEARIESSTEETVYMVNTVIDGMEMTNHKWVVESELQPAQ